MSVSVISLEADQGLSVSPNIIPIHRNLMPGFIQSNKLPTQYWHCSNNTAILMWSMGPTVLPWWQVFQLEEIISATWVTFTSCPIPALTSTSSSHVSHIKSWIWLQTTSMMGTGNCKEVLAIIHSKVIYSYHAHSQVISLSSCIHKYQYSRVDISHPWPNP